MPTDIVAACVRLKNIEPLHRLSNPATSKIAAANVARYSDNQAAACLYAILASGPFGMTYYEVEQKLDMRSAKQRVSDLVRHGLIVPTGDTRVAYGSPATVYRASVDVVLEVNGREQGVLF